MSMVNKLSHEVNDVVTLADGTEGIIVDIDRLSSLLGIPVVGVVAKKKIGLSELMDNVNFKGKYFDFSYGDLVDSAIDLVCPLIDDVYSINPRWIALKLISGDSNFCSSLRQFYPRLFSDKLLNEKVIEAYLGSNKKEEA